MGATLVLSPLAAQNRAAYPLRHMRALLTSGVGAVPALRKRLPALLSDVDVLYALRPHPDHHAPPASGMPSLGGFGNFGFGSKH